MKLLSAVILLNVLALYNINADQNAKIAPEVITTTAAPITSSSLTPPTTLSTTPKPTTTSSTTTTTTVAPITTSASPPTAPTTTPSTSTTSVPTTSAAPVTTTVAPTPGPQQGTWEVTNSTNSSCIVLKMAAEILVNFTTTDNNVANSTIFVPINANVTGNCSNNQTMTLSFSFVNGTNNTIQFLFSENDKKFELDAVNVTLVLDSTNFPGAKNKTLNAIHKKVDFVTPVGMSYKCDDQQALDLYLPNTTTSVGALKISKFQFQAYGNIINRHFADAKNCEPYETPDIVPIAVGCALMVLIVIVLVGYLIGRRRNQARGYLSMFTENKKEADYIPMKNLSCFQ